MLKTLIVADDSTGANASAILLNQLGFQSLSIIDYSDIPKHETFDCVAVSTDSRATTAENAYSRVETVLKHYKGKTIKVINKRVDSTLRGNLGAELNAIHEYFPNKKIAIIPAFPKSGRICKDGKVFVNGVLLEQTDVAKDPKMPLFSSDAKSLFLKQFKGKIANIYLKDLELPTDEFIDKVKKLYKDHQAIVFDAVENEHILQISRALVLTNEEFITVDPGPFTLYYTKALMEKDINPGRYYYVVGSVTDTTFKQLKTAYDQPFFHYIFLDAEKLLNEGTAKKETERVLKEALNSKHEFTIIATTDPENRKVLNLHDLAIERNSDVDAISKIINVRLAMLLSEVIEKAKDVKGIFTSGGDVTLSFLTHSGAKGIKLEKEVVPLCVYGKVVEGKFDSLNIITKGGMIGDENTYLTIKTFFEGVKNYAK